MTEPVIVRPGGTRTDVTRVGPGTVPTYQASSSPTVSGPVVRPIAAPPPRQPAPDPVLAWLASYEAERYRNHWVALDPETGRFLGLADALPDLRRWQAQ